MMAAPCAPGFGDQPLLVPLGWLFGSVVRLRNSAYDRGLLAVRHLPVPVVSVGNLMVGGTGKTPLVAALARRLAARGRRPAVVLRGYAGRNARRPGGPALVVSEGKSGHLLANVDQAGDEALLLATSLPSVPVVVSARRYHGGMQAITTCGADLVILDDG
ncbi:MAG: tetraacyldisaccharide 4'-kinase, partial [Acidobacteria bacterium]|nr:tetraacyldisaccharide 4'-kinase [Acidobacteriota bacterium]